MNKRDLSKPTKHEVLSQKLFINSNMAIIDEADLNNHCSLLNMYLDVLLIDYDLEKGYFVNTYRVKFKSWNRMAKEYGFYDWDTIVIPAGFVQDMKHLCGTEATIKEFIDKGNFIEIKLKDFTSYGDNFWSYCEEMFTKVNTISLTFIDDVEQLAEIFKHTFIDAEKAEILAGKKVTGKLKVTLNDKVKYFIIKSKRKDIQYIVKAGFLFREHCFKEYQKDEDM